jgi:hypothetical protein
MLVAPCNEIASLIINMFELQDRLHSFCPTLKNSWRIAKKFEFSKNTFVAGISDSKLFLNVNSVCTQNPNVYMPVDQYHIAFSVPTFDFDKKTRTVVPIEIKDRLTMFRCSRSNNDKMMSMHLMEIEQMLSSIYIGGYVFVLLPDKYRSSDMRYNRWIENNSAVVAKIELPQESVKFKMNEMVPYRPMDQYGSEIDTGEIEVENEYITANKWFLTVLFKQFGTSFNLDGISCPNSSKYPEPLIWSEYTYSPVIMRLKDLRERTLEDAAQKFKESEWFKMSVFQWNKMLKSWSNSTKIFGREYSFTKKLQEQADMFIAEPSQLMEQRLRIIKSLRSIKNEPNYVQIKITRSGIKIIAHNQTAKCSVHDFIISKGFNSVTKESSIEYELKKDFDSVKFALISDLYQFGLIPCMLESENISYEKRRRWLNRQLTPIERYSAVAPEVRGMSKFSNAECNDWDISNADIGLRLTMEDQIKTWERRAKTIRLDSPVYTFGFQLDDILVHAMKDGLVNGSIMGLGKTRELLFSAVLRGFKKVLIICPKRLIGTWQDEIEDLLIPFGRRVRRHWNGSILNIEIPNVIEFASNCRSSEFTTFNIISYDKLKSTPRDANFFKCPKCGFVTFSTSQEDMRCPGDPFYYDVDPMQDKSCVGQLRRWKLANSERDESGKLKYQKHKVCKATGKKVHWNESHPSRNGIKDSECVIVDTRKQNPYRDPLTGGRPRPNV